MFSSWADFTRLFTSSPSPWMTRADTFADAMVCKIERGLYLSSSASSTQPILSPAFTTRGSIRTGLVSVPFSSVHMASGVAAMELCQSSAPTRNISSRSSDFVPLSICPSAGIVETSTSAKIIINDLTYVTSSVDRSIPSRAWTVALSTPLPDISTLDSLVSLFMRSSMIDRLVSDRPDPQITRGTCSFLASW